MNDSMFDCYKKVPTWYYAFSKISISNNEMLLFTITQESAKTNSVSFQNDHHLESRLEPVLLRTTGSPVNASTVSSFKNISTI